MPGATVDLIVVIVLAAIAVSAPKLALRWQSRQRLFNYPDELATTTTTAEPKSNPLERWLFLAGYRRPNAAALFLLLTACTAAGGIAALWGIRATGLVAAAERAVSGIPGGVGDIFRPALYLGPWIVLITLVLLPTLTVRRSRRARVAAIEQDLPVTLDLLATLAEAGLGFDGAVNRIIASQPVERPLADELRTLQVELLSGRARTECLRRVARRLDIASVTIFISALVQAEQVGAGVATVLRQQADDLRQRRRERALELSMSLPVKRMFPMVICFLPGILLIALGPTFHEFFKYADTIIRMRRP